MAPPRDEEERTEGKALSPEDLDISSEERVAEIEDGRFVIGAEGPPNAEGRETAPSDEPDTGNPIEETIEKLRREAATDDSGDLESIIDSKSTESNLTGTDVKRWIGAELDRTDSQYAYRIAAKTGETISHQQLASDDIGTAFDGLMMWYARQVAEGTPVEEALGILLAESSIRVRFPLAGVLAYLDAQDLGPDDSIGDLLDAIRESDGLVFPLRHQRR